MEEASVGPKRSGVRFQGARHRLVERHRLTLGPGKLKLSIAEYSSGGVVTRVKRSGVIVEAHPRQFEQADVVRSSEEMRAVANSTSLYRENSQIT